MTDFQRAAKIDWVKGQYGQQQANTARTYFVPHVPTPCPMIAKLDEWSDGRRPHGFYWVKLSKVGAWVTVMWQPGLRRWFSSGTDKAWLTAEIFAIDERRILPPE